jgi:protein ImuA
MRLPHVAAASALPVASTVPTARPPARLEPSVATAALEGVEALHPALWRAHRLGLARQGSTATGYAALDRELPGQGWPHRALTELLLPHPGVGELRLLAPALARVVRMDMRPEAGGGLRHVLCFNPPAALCAQALQELGLNLQPLVLVQPAPGQAQAQQVADMLWALEQTLHSGQAAAVLAWLPEGLRPDALRRLQLAVQHHDGPLFLLRHLWAQRNPSPAPLRLALRCAGLDVLELRVLKRRGPALAQALTLHLPPVLDPAWLNPPRSAAAGVQADERVSTSADAQADVQADVQADAQADVQADVQAEARASIQAAHAG